MKIAYFDCFAGISGDMLLGSFIDAGVPFEAFKQQIIRGLALEGIDLQCFDKTQQGIKGKKIEISWDTGKHNKHRHLKDIFQIIEAGNFSEVVKQNSRDIFTSLAVAEAKVHGTSIEKVHFHEVGAIDSIIDIVGSALCLEILGIEKVFTSPLPLTQGYIHCEHGLMPCPAPATMELLKGIPTYSNNLIKGEIITPTGAAFLSSLADTTFVGFDAIDSIGYGSGTKELPVPNFLRVMIGEELDSATSVSNLQSDQVYIIETNIDDMNPEIFSHLFDCLFDNGALDVFVSNILMKKSRPAYKLTVLATNDNFKSLIKIILKESSSLGVRYRAENRWFLERKSVPVETDYGTINIKLGYLGTDIIQIAPEYVDCQRVARQSGQPLKTIYSLAIKEYYNKEDTNPV